MKNSFYLVISGLLIFCGKTNSQIIENIGPQEFQRLVNKEDGIIIDVRTPDEFYAGHIKDATNIDFYSDEFINNLEIVSKDFPIYVYCRSGGRSSLAAVKMEKLGFTKVYNLLGGIGEWESANCKTIKSKEIKKLSLPTFTDLEIDNFLSNNEVVLINFSTQWCVPCKKMKPVIQDLQRDNLNIKVLFIDANVNKELVKKYQIKGVPVFIVFKNTSETFRHVGVISKGDLLKQLN